MAELNYTKGEWGKTQLEKDLRNILREFYGQMKELQKSNQPEFNRGLDGICTYDEAIEKILKRTATLDLYEALKGLCPCQRPIPSGDPTFEWAISERAMAIVRKALAKAEGK